MWSYTFLVAHPFLYVCLRLVPRMLHYSFFILRCVLAYVMRSTQCVCVCECVRVSTSPPHCLFVAKHAQQKARLNVRTTRSTPLIVHNEKHLSLSLYLYLSLLFPLPLPFSVWITKASPSFALSLCFTCVCKLVCVQVRKLEYHFKER